MIELVYAHPYPDRSLANRALLDAVRDVPEVSVRSLYDLYPDYAIDVEAEQARLERARVLVFQHPIHWYGPPALLKLWFEKVLTHGFAYGEGGNALRGKPLLWVATTGGDTDAYSPSGMHGHPFAAYEPPMRQTGLFCGMTWEEPIVLLAAHRCGEAALREKAARYRARLLALLERTKSESRDA